MTPAAHSKYLDQRRSEVGKEVGGHDVLSVYADVFSVIASVWTFVSRWRLSPGFQADAKVLTHVVGIVSVRFVFLFGLIFVFCYSHVASITSLSAVF